MITIDALNEFGADTKEGLTRCLNKEDFYIRMINLGLKDARFETLGESLKEENWESAFEQAHALKGVLGNLALTPLFKPVSELTEKLRAKEACDYQALYDEMMKKRTELLVL